MIVGFSGYARAGKSEAANALRPEGWGVTAFADKLKQVLYTLNPVVGITDDSNQYNGIHFLRVRDVIDLHGWDGYKNTIHNNEIRRLIQTLGTECGRGILGEDVWVTPTMNEMLVRSDYRYWVVQDVRFPNEAQAIKDAGGKIVRIIKPGVKPFNDHPSETSLDYWDFDGHILNDGNIDYLHKQVRAASVHWMAS